ncbi:TetR family transcriptional regulator [Micromonospora sp. BRA006-A]|nr:TetR family transcriptional regulator [Micromonospora sp. BRA006-A]
MELAVTVLDEHGVEGLTMRLLAQRLDVTATALYWHVKTKDDVLDLAVDRVFGDDAGSGCRRRLDGGHPRPGPGLARRHAAPSLGTGAGRTSDARA